MYRVAISELDRPGLPAALDARGMSCAATGEPAEAMILGWRHSSGWMLDRLKRLRDNGAGPVMIVLPGNEEAPLVAMLDGGADDVVSACASDAVIVARLAAMLRRARPAISIGSLRIDPVDRRVVRGDREVMLLPREFRLLMALARQPGQTVTRSALLKQVCGIAFDPGTNVLDVHVSRLRAKLDRGFAAPMLLTDKGKGFRLAAD